ncbi:MAG: MFS transporter [Sphingobacteriales bacterium]|nr:MAG: MFS transporter [Sphingobacteriales bacterium]
MSLVSYLGRDQYGAAPLLYGPHFAAMPKIDDSGTQYEMKEGSMRYTRNDKRYIELGSNREYVYDGKDQMLFPRIWDSGNEQGHADAYASWLNIGRTQGQDGQGEGYETPTYADNIQWFITYQMGHMYWRYFMWNFAGKQNDIQGDGNKRDGNWISGIGAIDNTRLGDQSKLPESIRTNKANNKLFLLPFLLGVFGCVYHFLKDRKDWIVSFLLFFFTGIAIVLYLNQPGNQPRERDYAYAGSFYAYCIWIGLAVIGFVGLARERANKSLFSNALLYGSLATFAVTLMSNTTTSFGPAIGTALLATLMYALLVGAVTLVVRAVSDKGNKLVPAAALATLFSLAAPIVMGMQEWDDHDRSQKTLAPDVARDYLESCAPNAILFTFGDNDTYPLWYAQETEGVRPDIRIINTSLLGIDWYVNQLRNKVNQSAPIDVIWSPEQITGLSYIQLRPGGNAAAPADLLTTMRQIGVQQLSNEDRSSVMATLTGHSFTVPVDAAKVAANGTVNATDTGILSSLRIDLPEGKRILTLDQLTILNVIAANAAKGWERPIYFTSPYGDLGFGQYLRKDGMTYRLVPFATAAPQQNWVVDQALRGSSIRDNNTEWMYNVLMKKFRSGGADLGTTYFDEENRRHLLTVRSTFAEAAGNLADKGDKARAVQLLDHAESLISPKDMPYAMVGRFNSHNQTALIYLEAAYKAGHTALAKKLHDSILKDLTEQKAYYEYLKTEKEDFYNSVAREDDINNFLLTQLLPAMDRRYNPAIAAPEQPVPAKPGAGQ